MYSGAGVLWDSYLSFGGGDNFLIRILVQVDGLGLLHGLLGPWTPIQKPGPAMQRRAWWYIRRRTSH